MQIVFIMKNVILLFVLFFSLAVSAQELPEYKIIRYDSTEVKGYYFLSSNLGVIMLDKDVNVVYYKPAKNFSDYTLESNGLMVYANHIKLFLMDSTFQLVDSFGLKNNIHFDSHDRLILPDGNMLLLGHEFVNMDISPYHKGNKNIKYDTASIIFPVIQEQDNQHKVVFEWYGKEYFSLSDADSLFVKHDIHSNAFAMDGDGNILLSSKNLNEITKINRQTGAIIWRFGGKRNEFKFVNCPVPFYGQHDIKKMPNGHYTLFDNGDYPIPHHARAMEFELDETNKIATLLWSYETDMITEGRGSVQRLIDGNTLIGLGRRRGSDLCFEVVNPSGNLILQVSGLFAYRVKNYPSLPFRLHRPIITCFDSAGVKYLDAGAGYSSYKWNTGETTRIVPVKKEGSYFVFTPYGDGGFISSEKFIIADFSKSCGLKTSIKQKKK